MVVRRTVEKDPQCVHLFRFLLNEGWIASITSFRYQPCEKKSNMPLALAARSGGSEKQCHPHARCSRDAQRDEQKHSERKKFEIAKGEVMGTIASNTQPWRSFHSPAEANKMAKRMWTLWELNPRPFTSTQKNAKRLKLNVRRGATEGCVGWSLTNHTPRLWDVSGL